MTSSCVRQIDALHILGLHDSAWLGDPATTIG